MMTPLPCSAAVRIAALVAAAGIASASASATTIEINTTNWTITGDGDGDPDSLMGVPFTAIATSGGPLNIYLRGDLSLAAGESIRVFGDVPLRLHVAGDAMIASDASIRADALGITPGPGGGAPGVNGGGWGSGGSGGARGASGIVDGYWRGAIGGPAVPGASDPSYAGVAGIAGANSIPGGNGGEGSHGRNGQPGWGASNTWGAASGGPGGGGTLATLGVGGEGGQFGLISWSCGNTHGFYPCTNVQDAENGDRGDDGFTGQSGFPGSPGRGAAHDAPNLFALVGGDGGGAGGGGGGGKGGSSGAGGGSGGGGGLGGYYKDPWNGGAGGFGGWGGAGGEGGDGGLGGNGGAGAGAIEIRVYGTLDLQGSISSKGGNGGLGGVGQIGNVGGAGFPGGPGGDPFGGAFYNDSVPDWQTGAYGGDGGRGGNGGRGGAGGHGGAGGGGAGGTIILSAPAVLLGDAAGIDIRGGFSPSPDPVAEGEPGRFVLGSYDAAGDLASWLAGGQGEAIQTAGPLADNPFSSSFQGVVMTPEIAGLEGGAEAFGLTTGFNADTLPGTPGFLSAVQDLRNAGALAGLIRLANNHAPYIGFEAPGFDLVLLVNLTDATLQAPRLTNELLLSRIPLRLGGPDRDPNFGGAGDEILHELPGKSVFITLMPESEFFSLAQVDFQGQTYGAQLTEFGSGVAAIGAGLCPGDFSGDNAVGAEDLAVLIAGWGAAEPSLDLSGDGIVGAEDLATLIAAWGTCAE